MARHDRPAEEQSNVLPFKKRNSQPKVHWLMWVNLALILGLYIMILGHFA